MKKNTIILQEEKNRILNLHYDYKLLEQTTQTDVQYGKPNNPNKSAPIGFINYNCIIRNIDKDITSIGGSGTLKVFQTDPNTKKALTYMDNAYVYYDNGTRKVARTGKIELYRCNGGNIEIYTIEKTQPIPKNTTSDIGMYGKTIPIYGDPYQSKYYGNITVTRFDDSNIDGTGKGKIIIQGIKDEKFKSKNRIMQLNFMCKNGGKFVVPFGYGRSRDAFVYSNEWFEKIANKYCPKKQITQISQ